MTKETQKYIKSPLNYIGGKYKLIPQILPKFPKNINTFFDLFCGGCNIGLNVEAQNYVFNDNLTYLIRLYCCLQHMADDAIIIDYVQDIIDEFGLSKTNIEGYNKLRVRYNQDKNSLYLFTLICYSFNNQIRFNNKHEFNTSFGKDRSHFNENIKQNLKNFVQRIDRIDPKFTCADFKDLLSQTEFKKDDFVYADPPYLISTGSYNDGKRGFKGWTEKEELELLSELDKLDSKETKFALSNIIEHKGNANEILKDWLTVNQHYYIHSVGVDYTNANYQVKNRIKNKTIEVLITNYDTQHLS